VPVFGNNTSPIVNINRTMCVYFYFLPFSCLVQGPRDPDPPFESDTDRQRFFFSTLDFS
jgi:hypothetical protein